MPSGENVFGGNIDVIRGFRRARFLSSDQKHFATRKSHSSNTLGKIMQIKVYQGACEN